MFLLNNLPFCKESVLICPLKGMLGVTWGWGVQFVKFWYLKSAVFMAKCTCAKDPTIWFSHSSILQIKKKFAIRNVIHCDITKHHNEFYCFAVRFLLNFIKQSVCKTVVLQLLVAIFQDKQAKMDEQKGRGLSAML